MKEIVVKNNYTDVSVYKYLKKYTVDANWMKKIMIFDLLMVIGAIIAFFFDVYYLTIIMIVLVFVIYFLYLMVINYNIKLIIQKHQEMMGNKKVLYNIAFNEKSISMMQKDKILTTVNYQTLKNIIKTKQEYIFITNDFQVFACQFVNIKAKDKENLDNLINKIKADYYLNG